MGRLKGKTALVTGAGSGLGRAIARAFAGEGARVVCTDIDEAGLAGTVDGLVRADTLLLVHDVRDEARWDAVMGEAQSAFGGVHILVNNAGFVDPATIEDCTLEQFRAAQAVMLDGVFLGCRAGVAAMKDADRPCSIINMSSMAALLGYAPFLAYAAAKGGVRSLTKSVALHAKEQGYPIRCNSLHPSGIDTPMVRQESVGADGGGAPATGMIALGELGHANDVAQLAIYLASDASRFITAGEFPVDNGLLYQP